MLGISAHFPLCSLMLLSKLRLLILCKRRFPVSAGIRGPLRSVSPRSCPRPGRRTPRPDSGRTSRSRCCPAASSSRSHRAVCRTSSLALPDQPCTVREVLRRPPLFAGIVTHLVTQCAHGRPHASTAVVSKALARSIRQGRVSVRIQHQSIATN